MANLEIDPERVTALVDKWRELLGLGREWSLGVKVAETPEDLEPDDREEHRDSFAFTRVEEAYFIADITFCAWRLREKDKDNSYLDLVACHEVTHVVLHKLEALAAVALGARNSGLCTILTENAVEHVSRALVRLQDAAEAEKVRG